MLYNNIYHNIIYGLKKGSENRASFQTRNNIEQWTRNLGDLNSQRAC